MNNNCPTPINEATHKERIITFDLLRIVAAFAVILLHVSALYWYNCFPSTEWEIRNLYDTLTRWSVPVFVMISGALFLDSSKTISLKRLYKKNVVRIVVAYLLWSIFYLIFYSYRRGYLSNFHFNLISIINGPIHLWFLKMLAGLYVVIPLLREIVVKRRLELYFLFLSLITTFILPMVLDAIGLSSAKLLSILNNNINQFGLKMAVGYSGYFVLGHYLYNYNISRHHRMVIYFLTIISFVCVGLSTHLYSHHTHQPEGYFYSYLNVFTLMEASGIFLFFKYSFIHLSSKIKHAIILMSNCSFGIYLIHLMIVEIFFRFFLTSNDMLQLFLIPLLSLLVFVLSFFIISLLRKISFLKKYAT